MAYYDDKDELQGQQQQDPNAIPSGQQLSPGSGQIQSGAPDVADSGKTAGGEATPDRPGNFVGLQDYLKANRTQSSKLGNQVAGQVQGAIGTAKEDINTLNPRFNQQVDAGQISNIGGAAQEAQDITQQAAYGQGLGQDQQARFGEIANAQYQGPDTLDEAGLYQGAYQNVKKAQDYADLSKDESGSQQLLKDIYKAPSYSTGENLFDSYLLNSQENRAKLADARKDAQEGLMEQLAQADTQAAQYAAEQRALAESTREAARQGLTSTQTQRNTEVENELNAISKDWKSEYNKYLQLLSNAAKTGQLSLGAEEAKRLGVEKGQRIFNLLNPSVQGGTADELAARYLQMQEFDPNKVITKEQQAQLAALDELAGTFGGALQNKYTQKELAGTLNKDIAFAADQFGLSAKEAQTAFDAASQIANMAVSAEKSANVWDKTPIHKTVKEVRYQIVKNLPWPLSDIVEWATRWVEEVTGGVDIQVGHVDAKGTTQGTVADYLAGKAPKYEESGTKSLDLGTFLSPDYLISDRADNEIDRLQTQIQAENMKKWTDSIINYLKQAGYYNQIK